MNTLDIWELFEKSGIFNLMRRKLKAREPKQSWNETIDDVSLSELIGHLESEVKEFREGVRINDLKNIQEECADLANLCCFIFAKIDSK